MSDPPRLAYVEVLDFRLRHPSPEAERAAQATLLEVAFAFSPKVEEAGPGAVYLDLGGTDSLYPGAAGIATALDTALERVGLACRVGVAVGKTVARMAAHHVGLGVQVVEVGEEPAFLAPLPLSYLDPSVQMRDRLRGWGIRTLGELAVLSTRAIAQRLGPEGVRLRDLARGQDDLPFVSAMPPPLFEQVIRLDDWALSTLEPLLATLGQVIERLIERIVAAGRALGGLTLTLELDPRGHDIRHLEFAAPLAQLEAIMALARHELYLRPPPAAVVGIRAVGLPAVPQAVQGQLFAPPEPTPEFLAVTLARLRALVGEERVGSPRRPAGRAPAALASVPFAPLPIHPHQIPPRSVLLGQALPRPTGPLAPQACALTGPLIARVLRPPQPIEIHRAPVTPPGHHAGAIAFNLAGRALGVRTLAGPWILRDGWWTSDPVDREDYDVELMDGRLLRIYHDLRSDAWFLDGLYG